MGTLTLAQFQTEIWANLGNRKDVDAGRIQTILNLAQTRIARIHRWDELFHVEFAAPDYANSPTTDSRLKLPERTRDIHSLRVIDGTSSRKLIRTWPRRADEVHPNPGAYSTRKPHHYVRYADYAELIPVPDKSYTYRMRFDKWPTPLTLAAQQSDFEEKDDALIALATNWIFQSLGSYDKAGRWWTTYRDIINDSAQEQIVKPDMERVSESIEGAPLGTYYLDPFQKTMP